MKDAHHSEEAPGRQVRAHYPFVLGCQLMALRDQVKGETAISYALIAALAAAGIAGGLAAIAELVNLIFDILGDAARNAQERLPD